MTYHFEKVGKAAQSFRGLNEFVGENTIYETRAISSLHVSNLATLAWSISQEQVERLVARMLADSFNVDHTTNVRHFTKLATLLK